MNSLPWFGNVLGEIFCSALVCGTVYFFAWAKDEHVPAWGWMLAVFIGVQMWRKVDYCRPQDLQQ